MEFLFPLGNAGNAWLRRIAYQAARDYKARQFLTDAPLTVTLRGSQAVLLIRACVLRRSNLVFKGKGRIFVDFSHTRRAEDVCSSIEKNGGIIRAFKAYDGPKQEWALRACSLTKVLEHDSLEFFSFKRGTGNDINGVLYQSGRSGSAEML